MTALAKIRDLLAELVEERLWLEERSLLLPGDGTATEMRKHFAELLRASQIDEALHQAQLHYRAAVNCRVVPISAPVPPSVAAEGQIPDLVGNRSASPSTG